jgi:hypothetical protein
MILDDERKLVLPTVVFVVASTSSLTWS